MELLGIVVLIVVVYFLFVGKKKNSGNSQGRVKSFLPPIPSGYQIYKRNPPIAGIQYRKADAVRFAKASNQELTLEREPTNPHDSNAVKLIGVSGSTNYFLGYLPKELAEQIVATGLFDSVKARLTRIYLGSDDYLNIWYQIIGPKTEKKKFDAFLSNQPADFSQKEYLKFFNLPISKGLTAGQAEQTIAEHRKDSDQEEQAEWDGYSSIMEEFDDADFRETYDLKKVSKTVLLEAINELEKEGKSYSYLSDHIDKVVDRVIQLKPELEKQ